MGFVGSVAKIVLGRILPVSVLAVAVAIGWLGSHEQPMGVFFATLFPLMKGKLPATIVGHGKMTGTPPVPNDFVALSRPEKEMFLDLPGGYKMPQNGLGMCCRYSAYDDELVRRSVLWYLLLGGRSIDGAHLYLNHRAIGQGIRDAIAMTAHNEDESTRIKREDIFVTTKIFPGNFGYNRTVSLVPTFLEELGLDYIDLLLLHFPKNIFPWEKNECQKKGISDEECRLETLQALSELSRKGLLRSIGVSNFAKSHLEPVLAKSEQYQLEPIAVNQIQYNPWAPDFMVETFDYCHDKGIAITAYASLGGTLQHAKAHTVSVLQEISKNHEGRSVSQILLRWALQMGAAIIPGTGNPKHMKENLSVYEFELSAEEMAAIDELRSDEEAKKFFYMDPVD